MKAVKVKDNIYWVGGIDWDIRNFHGYLTPRGSTYNAYLIIDEKITLVDTVKHYLFDEMLERISSVIDPQKIDYVVSNHVEMDHSGGLPKTMALLPKAKLVTSASGEKGLKAHYSGDWDYMVVKSGDTLNLGSRNLTFVQTPMVHWPDNMVTYLGEDRILFSNDAFGQHIASPERFDDEMKLGILLEEAGKYYANIVFPYGSQVQKALEAVATLDIEIIAPSHGIIWRSQIPAILEEYKKWAGNETENKAVIVYDSMWGSTEKMAYAIYRAFEAKGVKTRVMNLKVDHISEVIPEVLTAKYICVGSPTLNNNMMPTVAAFLTYMKGLAPKNRIGLAFGSYGWGGQSVGQVEEVLQGAGFQIMEQAKLNYVPTADQLEAITRKIEEGI
ncbi:FprA family A-type flavoprotein [Dehalobacterium formicoaceticum]|uniref:FprA family A-type flavoprotein n=1 Tax=Dehalobacterium formicoaceticum TaxID=51515 RepID=A0ABT1Y4C2_9FIRM|nr:FprA family A-type flavoprotein [Dehalobacterium formicoaceticum]MCR6544764.1 FprA family A-type flavoprotein [Dehalobacterium formicoaceticum]